MTTYFATLFLALLPLAGVLQSDSSPDIMIDRTFDVRSGGLLDVDVDHSDVIVRTSDSNKARVVVRLDGRNMSKARDWFERMNFEVFETPDGLVVRAEQPERSWNSRKTGGAKIEVEIHLPYEYNITARTSHGDVELTDLRGRLDVVTSHGDVELGSIDGPTIHVRSSHGDIGARRMASASIRLQTSHADIEIGELKAQTINARTSHGDIDLGHVDGIAEIRTSHGDIRIDVVRMANADLKTSHGDILIDTARELDAELDLKGASARISSAIVFDGEVRKDRIEGRAGDGRGRISAHTTHGSVTLRTAS